MVFLAKIRSLAAIAGTLALFGSVSGRASENEAILTEAIAKLPKNAEVLDHIGDLHAKRSQWQQAIDSWSQALDGEGVASNKDEIQKKIENAKGKLPNAK